MSTLKPIRRLVAGNNPAGRSAVLIDGPAPDAHPSSMSAGRGHTDLWVWNDSPMALGGGSDDGMLKYRFPGEPRGGHLRVVQSVGRPADYDPAMDPEVVPHHPPKLRPGTTGTWDRGGNSLYTSSMHKTQTVDYGMMLNGNRELRLDEGTVLMQPGDIVIQVGAWHEWAYPTDAQMAFDMIGADFPGGVGTAIGNDQPLAPKPVPPGIRLNRRIVTIDRASDGRSEIVSDGPCPDVLLDPARPGFASQRMWATDSCPARIVRETLHLPRTLEPKNGGTTFRVDILPPDATWQGRVGEREVRSYFASAGSPAACAWHAGAKHPYVQKTMTFDYCVILEGETVLVLDEQEVVFRTGEVALLKGVRHAWSNRSGTRAVIAISSHDGRL
jgi:ethanolamine utilization protein EutQ (cupin superfamily)